MNLYDFLSKYCIRQENGLIDLDKTLTKMERDISKYSDDVEIEYKTISAAVEEVFQSLDDSPHKLSEVCYFVLQQLNVQPENHSRLTTVIMDYLHNHSDRVEIKDKDGNVIREAEPEGSRTFRITVGRNGGIVKNAKK